MDHASLPDWARLGAAGGNRGSNPGAKDYKARGAACQGAGRHVNIPDCSVRVSAAPVSGPASQETAPAPSKRKSKAIPAEPFRSPRFGDKNRNGARFQYAAARIYHGGG